MSLLGPGVVYSLCLVTSVVCAALLVRAWRRSRSRLLAWSAVAFVFLALNNLFVVLDMVLVKELDFTPERQVTALLAACVLIYAFIWEAE
jgi:hypothetical protein